MLPMRLIGTRLFHFRLKTQREYLHSIRFFCWRKIVPGHQFGDLGLKPGHQNGAIRIGRLTMKLIIKGNSKKTYQIF